MRGVIGSLLMAGLFLSPAGFAVAAEKKAKPRVHASAGIASVYAHKGGRTANGERVRPHNLTAAHRTLPFGTNVLVKNRRNGKSVVVRINDRGPFIRGRVIDLTPAGARALGFYGLVPVSLEVVGRS